MTVTTSSLVSTQRGLPTPSHNKDIAFLPLSEVLPPRIALLIERCTGGSRVIDALLHMPTHGVIKRRITALEKARFLPQGEQVILSVIISEYVPPPSPRSPYKIRVVDGQGDRCELIFFHARPGYLQKRFPIGAKKILCGTLNTASLPWSMIHPECLHEMPFFDKNETLFEPVYPLTAGLSNRIFSDYTHRLLPRIETPEEWLPADLLKRKGWPSWKAALVSVHKAQGPEALHPHTRARQRLFFDELLAHQLIVQVRRTRREEKPGRVFPYVTRLREALLRSLPFSLTRDQERALEEIDQDLSQPQATGRLLQGDVGTGKTLVALMAMLRVIEAGAQVAVLAPTEVLARQHYETFNRYLEAHHEVKTALLVGRPSGRVRR
ncbi:MAG: DEAD/DEAH box helicase family protein, partial [Holosporales bacterium]|nr:DEAD/DEAH box helicase family protein [Holosporales bacterium]